MSTNAFVGVQNVAVANIDKHFCAFEYCVSCDIKRVILEQRRKIDEHFYYQLLNIVLLPLHCRQTLFEVVQISKL